MTKGKHTEAEMIGALKQSSGSAKPLRQRLSLRRSEKHLQGEINFRSVMRKK